MKPYKKIAWLLCIPFILNILSCAKETMVKVTADFKITVVNNDYTVPVRVEIENLSTGADTYNWTFEGASMTSSTDKTPAIIFYNTPGKYVIVLKASNKDGSSDEKRIQIDIDAAMKADFDWEMQGSEISPVTLQMVNKSLGSNSYQWTFENGTPASSNEANPKVVFASQGDHLIKLVINNGKETYSVEKSINVKPAMVPDFDWTVEFIDMDYEAPIKLFVNNKSTNATSYEWTLSNVSGIISRDQNPIINIATAGTYSLQMKATNDKESRSIQKQIIVYPNKNLLSFSNIKLGINTAHGSIGCFFSSTLGKVLTNNDVNEENGSKIDFAFFGLNANFVHNQFVSPDQVQNTTFRAIPNAIHTKIINSQELSGVQLTAAQFDGLVNGNGLASLTVSETTKGLSPFDQSKPDRIIVFQTADGRKGAIKVLSYISNDKNSYILTDIKVQKTPN